MLTQSHFLRFWRDAEANLKARRRPGLSMGRAHLYWLCGFSPEVAAEAELLRATFAPRTLH